MAEVDACAYVLPQSYLYSKLVLRARVPFGQHQDTELWKNQQARSQSLRGFAFKIRYCCAFKAKFRHS